MVSKFKYTEGMYYQVALILSLQGSPNLFYFAHGLRLAVVCSNVFADAMSSSIYDEIYHFLHMEKKDLSTSQVLKWCMFGRTK